MKHFNAAEIHWRKKRFGLWKLEKMFICFMLFLNLLSLPNRLYGCVLFVFWASRQVIIVNAKLFSIYLVK